MRDQLVVGLRSDNIQKRLLSEKDLTYEKAIALSTSLETAAKDSRELGLSVKQKKPGEAALHRFGGARATQDSGYKHSSYNVGGKRCFRCNSASHFADRCRLPKDITCRSCSKKGHVAEACMSSNAKQNFKPKRNPGESKDVKKKYNSKSKPRQYGNLHRMNNNSNYEAEDDLADVLGHMFCTTSTMDEKHDDVLWVYVKINNVKVKMEVDTGSKVSVLPLKIY